MYILWGFLICQSLAFITTQDNLYSAFLNLRRFLNCRDQPYDSIKRVNNNHWLLQNYFKADHGQLNCSWNVTYTTHADYRYLDNLVPLLERWRAPVSLALYAPGSDFEPTLKSILWLLKCHPQKDLVRGLTTFHIYFGVEHMPKVVPNPEKALAGKFECTSSPPYENVTEKQLYRIQKGLTYPVNIGRNLARDASLTHYVLASDIELYPSPGLVPAFLIMLSRKIYRLNVHPKWPVVYALRLFEIEANASLPNTKTEVQELLSRGEAIPFHVNICAQCHTGPKLKEWINANISENLDVFNVGKRTGEYWTWEPIFIGTTSDPPYDERLSWEGMREKMTQAYAMCALGYEFHILDNAFLVHKPGIKSSERDPKRSALAARTYTLIRRRYYRELRVMYGEGKGCNV